MSIKNKIWDIKDYSSKRELFQAFFNEARPFFESADKKAVFMTGFLAQKLLNFQSATEHRKPFRTRLKGLKLNKTDVVRLLGEIKGKLLEYENDSYDEEFDICSELIIESNNLKRLSDLDIPFYFSLGMNMVKSIKTSKSADSSDEADDEGLGK